VKRLCRASFAAAIALAPAAAFANGLGTHTWITLKARELVALPALKEFVNDAALTDALISGTIFPDGGYAVSHPYGGGTGAAVGADYRRSNRIASAMTKPSPPVQHDTRTIHSSRAAN
jgi:hypothetical protein